MNLLFEDEQLKSNLDIREIECLLNDNHQKGKMMIMIMKTSGSQVDSRHNRQLCFVERESVFFEPDRFDNCVERESVCFIPADSLEHICVSLLFVPFFNLGVFIKGITSSRGQMVV